MWIYPDFLSTFYKKSIIKTLLSTPNLACTKKHAISLWQYVCGRLKRAVSALRTGAIGFRRV